MKAKIKFGKVTFHVGVQSVISEKKDIGFRTLHDKCSTPVEVRTTANIAKEPASNGKAALNWCPTCKKEATGTLKGFEISKGEFIPFTEEEIETAKGGKPSLIVINKFIAKSDLQMALVEKTHFLVPSDHEGERYGLLYQALAETKKVGIGHQQLWGKGHPCAICASHDFAGGVLLMVSLHPEEDLVEPTFTAPIPSTAAKRLAKEIIAQHTGELEAGDLVSLSRQGLDKLISARVNGAQIPDPSPVMEEDVVDLMEALRESVAASKPAPKRKTAVKK